MSEKKIESTENDIYICIYMFVYNYIRLTLDILFEMKNRVVKDTRWALHSSMKFIRRCEFLHTIFVSKFLVEIVWIGFTSSHFLWIAFYSFFQILFWFALFDLYEQIVQILNLITQKISSDALDFQHCWTDELRNAKIVSLKPTGNRFSSVLAQGVQMC